ncbi:MAG: response regulator [Planctomycetota bacterium]|nr:MAG: response regulator [Planctomycetota bacterium]
MTKQRLLIVEDDRALSDILNFNLQREGFQVFTAYDGREALELARLKKPDLILLDVMLPLVSGIDVCRQLRRYPETAQAGIIMLTARGQDIDQIGGFEAGADDYVVKPYSLRVLIERIRALLRRKATDAEPQLPDHIEHLGVKVDLKRVQATIGGAPLDLTPSEFKLLAALMADPGRAFDRNELIEAALGGDTVILERTIDVHIRALRKKLGPHAHLIETVRGVGYRFKEAD